jgi:predicted CXXCH cytochrome family protein
MKLRLIIFIITSLCILTLFHFSKSYGSIVSDECEACHGIYPGMMEEVPIGEPQKFALQAQLCIDCHSSAGRDTIKILGGVRVPVIHNTTRPVSPLSGGNFYYVATIIGDRKGHNVDGIASMDTKFRSNPPGYDRESDPSVKGYNFEKPLTCAGSNGCHGNRNIENPFVAIRGSHHADDMPIDGSTTAKSYRYLKSTDKIKGVLGLEDPDWGQNNSVKKHNEYSPSMDTFCANCHGNFYRKDKIGKMSPWFRHPAGILLPNRDEYANYNPEFPPSPDSPGIRMYSPDAPIARDPVPATPVETVEPGADMVFCLSCHVAHASPNDSMLRWDYDAIVSGESGGGCLICHTGKGE